MPPATSGHITSITLIPVSKSSPGPVALRDDLRKALVEEGLRKIEAFTARHGVAVADWPALPFDPFFNINTPDDAAEAERIATLRCGA